METRIGTLEVRDETQTDGGDDGETDDASETTTQKKKGYPGSGLIALGVHKLTSKEVEQVEEQLVNRPRS